MRTIYADTPAYTRMAIAMLTCVREIHRRHGGSFWKEVVTMAVVLARRTYTRKVLSHVLRGGSAHRSE